MTEDDQLLLACYIINWITLVFIGFYSANKKKYILLHIGVQAVYSVYWWYQFKYNSRGGAALATWFFWMLTIVLHWIGCFIQLVLILNKSKK